MIISETAKIYAKGLIQTAQDGAITYDTILEQLNIIIDTINNSKDLEAVLNSPTISFEQKILIIDDIFAKDLNFQIINFLKLLAEKNRFNELKQIVLAFQLELDVINGIKRAVITSAINLSDENKDKIINKLTHKLGKNVIAEWVVNEDIVGGLLIQIDDNIIDTSVKNKLEKLSKIKGNI